MANKEMITVYRMARDEMRLSWERTHYGIASFRGTATTILSASSVLAAFLSAFQVFLGHPQAGWAWAYNLGMIVMFGLYGWLISCCIAVIFPVTFSGPVMGEWENLRETYFDNEELEALEKEISGYISTTGTIREVVVRLKKRTKTACILLPLVVIVFMLMLLIPRA